MIPLVSDRQSGPTERTVLFSIPRKGRQRYMGVTVYVFTHPGEYPSVIIRPSDDCYDAPSARRHAALLLNAADWVEQNVKHRKVKEE